MHRAVELTSLEVGIYVSLDGVAERAAEIAVDAQATGDTFGLARANLARWDAIGRSGALEDALAAQQAIAVAERGDHAVRARAGFVLASTFFRLGMSSEAQDASVPGPAVRRRSCKASTERRPSATSGSITRSWQCVTP